MKMKPLSQEECRKLQILMLKEIDTFCKAEGITYFLAFGTLIGAVRHKGFIPWDDDIDIMMPRKDYQKFECLFRTVKNYQFLTKDNTQNYPYAYGKVIDIRTVKQEPLRSKYQVIGLDIDIFPIDNYPDELEEAKDWCRIISQKQKLLDKILLRFTKWNNTVRFFLGNLSVFARHLFDDTGFCSVKKLVAQIDLLSQKYNSIETNYCGISVIATYGERKRNRKEIYSSSVDLLFEGSLFSAPIGYHEYLTDIYGDYMQLPPEDKRKTHHTNTVYWK